MIHNGSKISYEVTAHQFYGWGHHIMRNCIFCLFLFFFFKTGFSVYLWSLLSWNSFYSPGWPQTHKDPTASASLVLGSKACTTIAWQGTVLKSHSHIRKVENHWFKK